MRNFAPGSSPSSQLLCPAAARRFAKAVTILLVGLASCGPVIAQTAPVPADARAYVVVSTSGRNGTLHEWASADGLQHVELQLNLRGQLWKVSETMRPGPDGTIAEFTRSGTSPSGSVAETFQLAHGVARWQSPIDKGEAAVTGPANYLPSFAYPSMIVAGADEWATKWAVTHPGQATRLLPRGAERVTKLAATTVGEGVRRRPIFLWQVDGLNHSPRFIWLETNGDVFANLDILRYIREGYEAEIPALLAIQDQKRAEQVTKVANALPTRPAQPVAFRDVRTFSDGKDWREHQTVLVEGGKIVAAGPVASVHIPPQSMIIDGKGMTLLPGLWDAHMHVQDDYNDLSELSIGVTSLRDPGNYNEQTLARRKRRAAGELLMPHVYASSVIDGAGPYSASVATVVRSLPEALKAVDDAKTMGMIAIKIYGSLDPAWVAPMAAEAHRIGLHVHGHVPAGMRPADAIKDGYDEITHIYFVAMQAMPQAVVDHSNSIARFSGIGAHMKDIDLNAEPMAGLVAEIGRKHLWIDPTLVVAESIFDTKNGEVSPAYAPFVKAMPGPEARNASQGGFEPPAGVTQEDFHKSYQKLSQLVGALHKAGANIVAGTDGAGLELVRELELYVAAGFSTGDAMRSATILPATLVGADTRTGSIAVGKDADLVLVAGNPAQNISDLRNTRIVMMDGLLMQADALREAVSMGQEKPAAR